MTSAFGIEHVSKSKEWAMEKKRKNESLSSDYRPAKFYGSASKKKNVEFKTKKAGGKRAPISRQARGYIPVVGPSLATKKATDSGQMRVTDRKTGNKVNFGGWNGKQGESMVRKSAFGVDHAHEVSKGAWGNAAAMTTGKALQSGQKMANKAAPKVKTGAVKAKSFAQGAAGKLPTDPGAGKAGNAFRQKVKQNPMKATVGAAGVGGTAMGLKPKKQQA